MQHHEKQTTMEMVALLHDQPYVHVRCIVRDCRTFSQRANSEGARFLNHVLPKLGKAIDTALSGNVTLDVKGIFKTTFGTRLPHFLGSTLRYVFNSDGTLLDNPNPASIAWLRTFCTYAYKIEAPFSQYELEQYSENFRSTDDSIGQLSFGPEDEPFLNLMRNQLSCLDEAPDADPSYGPGVSSNCDRSEKYNTYTPPSNLRNHFGREFFHNRSEHAKLEVGLLFLSGYWEAFFGLRTYLGWDNLTPSKVLFVPKDARGPRVICCEDSRLMWAQKAIQKRLYRHVESAPRFAGRVNFTDQSVNQRLTFDSSNATLDLKEASDRVSLLLVQLTFPPKTYADLIACRSTKYTLPSSDKIFTMKKFAPMGSAVCFPVMALLAYTSVCAQIYLDGGPLPHRNTSVYVYGDDIIVPNVHAASAIKGLERAGFLVNRAKSFVNSRFRESCGQDTFDTTSVTSLKKRANFGSPTIGKARGRKVFRNVNGILHYVSLANSASARGYLSLAATLRERVEQYLGPLPYGVPESPYLCWYCDPGDVYVFNQALGAEVRGTLPAYAVRDDALDVRLTGPARLRRQLIEGGGEKPIRPDQIGARSIYLQRYKFVRHGTSYGSHTRANLISPSKFNKIYLAR